MKPIVFAALLCAAIAGVGIQLAFDRDEKPLQTGSIGPAIASKSADPRTALNVVKVDWRREGFGLTAVADVSVRNNNDYAVRIDRVNCRFRGKSGETEEHGQGVYDVLQPRAQKVIRDVSLGFVSDQAKGLDCSISAARKEL